MAVMAHCCLCLVKLPMFCPCSFVLAVNTGDL
nr:MAG TPA: hypothetical protein [Caudoviricetes sp.]